MKTYKGLKIITAILFVIAFAFSTWMMVDIIIDAQADSWASLGIIAWIAVAVIALAIPLLFAIIGLVITIIKRAHAQCSVGTLVYFIVFTLLPFVVFFGSILVFNIAL